MARWELARNVSPRMKRFREVNERLAEVATQFIEVETHTEKVDFTCECGRAECAEPITMTLIEYEAIRAEPTHFGVIPGHEQPEIESVIRRFPNYLMTGEVMAQTASADPEVGPRSPSIASAAR
jgi:hypothetical protein